MPPNVTVFVIMYSSMPYLLPSLPNPDCLTPPKGAFSLVSFELIKLSRPEHQGSLVNSCPLLSSDDGYRPREAIFHSRLRLLNFWRFQKINCQKFSDIGLDIKVLHSIKLILRGCELTTVRVENLPAASLISPVLTPIIPTSKASATRYTRWTSFEKKYPANPTSVLFANLITSASVLKENRPATGPKVSS